jgi:hypothetical protein
MNDTRPKWLRGSIAVLAAWWTFLTSLILALALAIGVVDAVLPGDGLPVWPGAILAILSLFVAVFVVVKTIRIQDQRLARCSRRVNVIVFAVLLALTLLLMPMPFTYTIF